MAPDRYSRVRYHCERCRDTYDEENVEGCARCHRIVCPRCSTVVTNPVKNAPEWKCIACLFPKEREEFDNRYKQTGKRL